ncbi:unnamed protein product [Camellia sinensis]
MAISKSNLNMATGLEGCNASKIVYDVLPSNHLVIGSACVFENPTGFNFHGCAGIGCVYDKYVGGTVWVMGFSVG